MVCVKGIKMKTYTIKFTRVVQVKANSVGQAEEHFYNKGYLKELVKEEVEIKEVK